MNAKLLRIFLSVCFVCGLAPAVLAADFSADMVSTEGGVTTKAKICASGSKIRMDMTEGVMIVRLDKQVSWMLMPSELMYMENPIDMSRVPRTSRELGAEMERTPLGTEVIDGKTAEKFKVVYNDNGKTESVYQWLVDGQIPVKTEAIDGSWSTEYKNLAVTPQPAELFEVPADYTKMEMPSFGSMMNMMME